MLQQKYLILFTEHRQKEKKNHVRKHTALFSPKGQGTHGGNHANVFNKTFCLHPLFTVYPHTITQRPLMDSFSLMLITIKKRAQS